MSAKLTIGEAQVARHLERHLDATTVDLARALGTTPHGLRSFLVPMWKNKLIRPIGEAATPEEYVALLWRLTDEGYRRIKLHGRHMTP